MAGRKRGGVLLGRGRRMYSVCVLYRTVLYVLHVLLFQYTMYDGFTYAVTEGNCIPLSFLHVSCACGT